jgi:peptidoglycan/xylan/chitin deacetylase (PgdA/CDA1 family)
MVSRASPPTHRQHPAVTAVVKPSPNATLIPSALTALAWGLPGDLSIASKTGALIMRKLGLIRYDTESGDKEKMSGFLAKAVAVHRTHRIPVSLFCTGGAVERREDEFRAFHEEVKDDPLFDVQDHSYSHIGVGYEKGKPVEVLRADYEKSFAAHERVFGRRPVGISICGTGGKDGPRLKGFDETEKSRAELDMLAGLGLRMINAHLSRQREDNSFLNYGSLGHPLIMGFPSGFSDTSWMYRKERGEPMEYILSLAEERAAKDEHLPVMLHDWVAWLHASDKSLTHVVAIAEKARELGYELATHIQCLEDETLWRDTG